MSGSLSLIIVLIVVVWAIVLAPMVLGDSKPIRRSGEGYEETRVLHQGGTAPVQARRRPRLTEADIHRFDEDDDYEVVDAEHDDTSDTATTDAALIDDTPRAAAGSTSWKKLFAKTAAAPSGGSTALSVRDDSHDHGLPDDFDADDSIDGEIVDAGAEAVDADDASDAMGEVYSGLDDDDEALAEYDLDDSYLSPEDYGYSSSTVVTIPANADTGDANDAGDANDIDDAAEADSAVDADDADISDPDVDTAEADPADAAGSTEESAADAEPTEDDIAFARSRRGRGGWDPEAAKRAREDRFRRRQRTLLGLIVLTGATFVAALVAGGWTWLAPVVFAGLLVWYMTALRQLVKQERALHARRVRQLRRARLGVVSGAEDAPVPAHMRRPGAVILELDDESADFSNLPAYSGATRWDGAGRTDGGSTRFDEHDREYREIA